MKRATVLGAGAWGTTLAKLLAEKGNHVELLTIDEASAVSINERRENAPFLPGFRLPEGLHATADLELALRGCDLVVVAVPSHAVRDLMRSARTLLPSTATIVSATKGIENDTLLLMGEVIVELAGAEVESRLAFLSGPSFASEVAAGLPTALVVASADLDVARSMQRRFATDRFRVYTSDDPVGVQMGGAIKNVIAIAAGASEGLGYGHNARAALITRGLAEIGRLASARGAHPRSLSGLAGLGDLVLTCTGELSRNRTVGFEMGRGRSLSEVLSGLGHVAEGVTTAKSVHQFASRAHVEMPICAEVYAVLYEGKSVRQAVADLMGRELKAEF